ncbi:hypothetical protein LWI29_004457 [Acer saccharum]|uniref:CRAL-TRIO domain-containing protein n=1 Tax=Acer saccharum TaxID=4024 RepID=A0AA39RC71_ACESA|nr:hypothetical protein LWI29_004457 [Acer saccharum]
MIYEGNRLLCGLPLPKSCDATESPSSIPGASTEDGEDSNFMDMDIFYISFTISYALMGARVEKILDMASNKNSVPVSRVEHGVLHLVDAENPHITVLVDCEGLSPLRIPMQLLRSCSSRLQDHFPNRLGCLLVIRLPPVVRVISLTFTQTLPAYLGGNCTCTKCSKISIQDKRPHTNETNRIQPYADVGDDEDLPSPCFVHQDDTDMDTSCHKVFRTAVIGNLMVWALIAGMVDPESCPF